MAIRSTTHVLKNSDIVNRPLPGSLLKGEPIVNTAEGILYFSGITTSSIEWTPAGTGTSANFFEVGSNLYDLRLRNQITKYQGQSGAGLLGKFLSGTTSGFVLADITSIQGVDRYVTGGTVTSTGNLNLFRNDGVTVTVPKVTYWTSGSTGTDSIKAINSSGLDSTGIRAVAWGNQTLASGNDSTAWGIQTSATTLGSTSQGNQTLASGQYSHAEGNLTKSIGDYSHSEGWLSIASGQTSHAEGYNTKATGIGSHSEGYSTTASGDYSHAEGHLTKATGYYSHSEGIGTTASGPHSHAEGNGTTASSYSSHAEGRDTTASGYYSHAEGRGTTASGNYSHAEGRNTVASGQTSHAEGQATTALGYYSHAEGGSTIALGNYSHASGSGTTASGIASFTSGFDTNASGNGSHAEGYGTTASGPYSHAEGSQTTSIGNGSHAEGSQTTASGNYSHSEGLSTTSSGPYSHSEGNLTTASGNYSHAEGGLTTASGYYSHAEGNGTLASGQFSHAEGYQTSATTTGSHSEGYLTTASGIYSHAEGFQTTSSGQYSHAEGDDTQAIGNGSHAEGYGTQALGYASHTEGKSTTASGDYSHAQGGLTTSSGLYSFASGYGSEASGHTSFIHSTNSLVTGSRSVVLGGQNITGSANDTVYVPYLNLNYLPTLNSSNTEFLTRNTTTGNVERTPLSAVTTLDTFVTGFTYNSSNNTFTISRNQGQSNLTASIGSVSGLTISNLTAGRVVYVGVGGLLKDESGFEYNESSNLLTVGNINVTNASGTTANIGQGGLVIGSGGSYATPGIGDLTVHGNLVVFGTASTVSTNELYVEDPQITLNYNPSGDTSSTSIASGIRIQDGDGLGNDVLYTVAQMNTFTGGDVTEYTGANGYTNRGFMTQLNDIIIRNTNSNNGAPDGRRVLAEQDVLDGGSY